MMPEIVIRLTCGRRNVSVEAMSIVGRCIPCVVQTDDQ
jgi:hypothetical protein